MNLDQRPCLRPLDFQPITYQNQPMWLLRDPLKLSQEQLIFPAYLTQLLMFIDGTRTMDTIHADFCSYVKAPVDYAVIADTLDQLDAALLLDNDRSQQFKQTLLAEYRAQPYRQPALAGLSYPSEPDKLTRLFEGYGRGDDLVDWQPWTGRGIVSPHIDYERGGHVYAKVWRRAAAAVLAADLVVILGTDHNGGPGTVTLTRQAYTTPYGVLPTDLEMIAKLETAVGSDFAYAEELHHRDEHSVELSAVWLHYIYQQAGVTPKPMVPILVGSFHHFVANGHHPADDVKLTAVIDTIKREMSGKNVLLVASVDLAHVGPVFGDQFQMDVRRRANLRMADEGVMQTAVAGDAVGWYDQIAAVQDRNRICGFAPTYLMLRMLGRGNGRKIAYRQCAADPQNASFVSICGLLLD